MKKQFALGVDLGTSNSAVALCDLVSETLRVFEIAQVFAPGQVGGRPTLPSALYLPSQGEFAEGAMRLPWSNPEPGAVVGIFARDHGALVPDRLVTSAKSWLSSLHVDPRSTSLPWGSELVEEKISPFEACRLYLEHLREAFLHAEREEGRERNLDEGQVALTVPASFDEVARQLTAEAAEAAGFRDVVLLEEPQAAFYAWTEQAGSDWRNQVSTGDLVLVCDVGGGTADFSLIAVGERDGDLAVERVSVGEHLLLGGDNMDLALAYALQAKLEEQDHEIDDWQFLSLARGAGRAKVDLFADETLEKTTVAVPSRGSGLFAGSLSVELDRAALESVVLDGFFAKTAIDEMPQEEDASALQEFGLPFAADAVISKHLARFLVRSLQNVRASETLSQLFDSKPEALAGSCLMPTAILFNGGVFKAPPLRRRVLELLNSWKSEGAVRELAGDQPDLAVAKGAAVYARNRVIGKGIRIRAGTARSYYVGLESSRPSVPGFKPPIRSVCVVPQGMEEGSERLVGDRQFGLVTGRTAVFRFFSSEIRGGDVPGDIVPHAERDLEETSRLEVELPPMEEFPAGQPVPVNLHAIVTELGNLELWMKHTASDRRWKIAFQVRTE